MNKLLLWDITRQKALELALSRLYMCSDRELCDAIESLGYGENQDLPYFGHNFTIGVESEYVDVELDD